VVWPQNHWDGFLRFGLKTGGVGFLQFGLKTGGDGFSWFELKAGGGRFSSLHLKTDSFSLMIWPSKSPRRFLDFGLKIKRPTVCQLRDKTDRKMKTTWGTRRDLAACFMWKQVGLEFLSLASRLADVRCRVVHVAPSWRSYEDQVENGRVDALGCVRVCYPYFVIFILLGYMGIFVI
jgi:hypothetical protein